MRVVFVLVSLMFAAIAIGFIALGIDMAFARPASDHGGGVFALLVGAATLAPAYIFLRAAGRAHRVRMAHKATGTTAVRTSSRALRAALGFGAWMAINVASFAAFPGANKTFIVIFSIVLVLGAGVGLASIVDDRNKRDAAGTKPKR